MGWDRTQVRRLVSAVLTAALLAGMVGCSSDASTPRNEVPQVLPSESPSPGDETSEPSKNDLAKLPVKRSIRAGSLTVKIKYNTTLPLENWTPGISKPVEVSLKARNRRDPSQKIYLTKVSADVTAYDESGPVENSRTLTDATNINPGFIVTEPNTYNQRFLIPASSEVANRITIDFTYEFVLQVNKDKDGRNFSKEVATDSISAPLNQPVNP